MTNEKSKNNNEHFHVDFDRLEIEIRKSIKRDKMTEQLGVYVIKIVNSFLFRKQMINKYTPDTLDHFRFKAYDYIIRKLLKNYNVNKKAGFAFIRQMANNAIRSAIRERYKNGIEPVNTINYYEHKTRKRHKIHFITIT